MADVDGIHAAHCCAKHGCKYGTPGCPVVAGQVPQRYPCEQCDSEKEDIEQAVALLRAAGYTVQGPEEAT